MPPVITITVLLLSKLKEQKTTPESGKENPNYYSILPASVRYDNRLSPHTKLLYSEITALSNKSGRCWASNNYFADLYKVDRRSIIRWVNQLKECRYIDVQLIYETGKKEVKERIITLKEVVKIPSKGGDKNITTYGQNSHEVVTNLSPGVVTKLSIGSDKNVVDNTIHNNKEVILNLNSPFESEIIEEGKSFSLIDLSNQISDEVLIKLFQLPDSKRNEAISQFNLEYEKELKLISILKKRNNDLKLKINSI